MLKKMLCGLAVISICFNLAYANNNKVISYTMDNNQYMILVIQENNLPYEEAKAIGLKRAANLTKEQNFKYFEVKSDEEVTVILGKSNWPSSYDFPQNLYQEEIVEKGYDRERMIEQSMEESDNEPHSALKIIIQCQNDKTTNSIDPCEIIKCN